MTPETDAAVKASNGQWSFVLKETCQRLERERNKAREAVSAVKYYLTKERDDALSKIVQAEFRAEQFHQERDEAREVASGLAEQAKRLRKERDEAREDRDMAQRYALDSDHAYDLMVKAVDEAREELANIESLMFGGLVQFTPKDGIAWRVFYAVMELKKERDEARKEAEYYKERYEQLKDQYGR